MPNIKITGREQTIGFAPGPQLQEQDITPKIADTSTPWAALAKGADTLSDVANKVMIAKNRVDLSAAKVDYSTAVTQIQADAAKETDPEKAALHKDRLAALDEEYAKRYPNVWNQVVPYANHLKTTAGINIDAHGMKLTAEQVAGDAVRVVTAYGNTMAYARTPEEAAAAEAYIDKFLQDAVSVHAMTPAQAEHAKLTATQNASLAQASDDIRQNAEVAKSSLLERDENGSFVNYRYLSPGQRIQSINAADQRMKSERNDFYTNQHRLQETNRQNIWTMIDDPKKKQWETIAAIDTAMQPDANGMIGMPAQEGHRLKEAIQNGSLKEVKTNYRTWDNLYTRIQRGEDVSQQIGAAVANQQLSIPNAQTLRGLINKVDSGLDKKLQATLDQKLKIFNERVKVLQESGDETSKDMATAMKVDALEFSTFVKNEKDMEWFSKHLDESWQKGSQNITSEYLKKLQVPSGWYDEYMKQFGRTRRVGNIQTAPGGGTGSFDQQISQVFGKDAPTALRIAQAESGNDPMAHNPKGGGTGAFGLFQIRGTLHKEALIKAGIIQSENDLLDPDTNIRAAKFLYDRDGWTPWNESKAKWDKTNAGNVKTLSTGKKIRVVTN